MNRHYLAGLTAAGSVFAAASVANAEYIQSMGMSDRAIALAGAVVSDSRDFDAFYTNPAGAAAFDRPFIGAGVRLIDTRQLEFGEFDPVDTLTGNALAIAPGAAGYMPVKIGGFEAVVGVGFGAPFAIVGDWADTGPHSQNMIDQELFSIDLSPTVAFKLTKDISVGASLNIQTFNFLKLQTALDGLGIAGGALTLQTKDKFTLPVPPWGFDAGFEAVGVTLGAEANVMPGVKLGVAYRSKQENEFEGTARIRDGAGNILSTTSFKANVDLPGHLQVGGSFEVLPGFLTVFTDVQWTMWSDTDTFGKASVVKTPGLLGPVNGLRLDYKADDTVSFRIGGEITPASLPGWAFRAGYWYDPSPFPDGTVDILTYSSDRHIFSLGAGLDMRNGGSGWKFDVSGQVVSYSDRHNDSLPVLDATSLGGLDAAGTVPLSDATGTEFDYGGYIWSIGATVSYSF